MTENNDDLDDILDELLDQPINLDVEPELDEDFLDEIKEQTQPVTKPTYPDEIVNLDDLVEAGDSPSLWPQRERELEDFSYVEDRGSSLKPDPGLSFQRYLRTIPKGNVELRATQLLTIAQRQAQAANNPLDWCSQESKQALVDAMIELRDLEGGEISLIIRPANPPKVLTPAQSVAQHLQLMPVDSVAFVNVTLPVLQLVRELRRLGFREGLEYEMLDARSLMAPERRALNEFFRRVGHPLRLFRKLADSKPQFGKR